MLKLRQFIAKCRIRYIAFQAKDEMSALKLLDLARQALTVAIDAKLVPNRVIKNKTYSVEGRTSLSHLVQYLDRVANHRKGDRFPSVVSSDIHEWDRDRWGYFCVDRHYPTPWAAISAGHTALSKATENLKAQDFADSYLDNRLKVVRDDLRYLIIWLAEY